MGAKNWVGIGLSYRPARLHRWAASISWNRFLGFLKVKKYRLGTLLSGKRKTEATSFTYFMIFAVFTSTRVRPDAAIIKILGWHISDLLYVLTVSGARRRRRST
jgi:hypothetical protein